MGDEFNIMELMEKDEELHPDLEPWVQQLQGGTHFLNHPLVQEAFLNVHKAALVNKRYEIKRQRVEESLDEEQIHRYVFLHERPYRPEAFSRYLRLKKVDDATYWGMVETVWIDSENIWQHKKVWRELWSDPRPGRQKYVMDDSERAALAQLPPIVKVWRGCNRAKYHEKGLAWTLNKEKASWFARRYTGIGLVLEGRTKIGDIYAVLLGRGEFEAVCRRVTIVSRSYLEKKGVDHADPALVP